MKKLFYILLVGCITAFSYGQCGDSEICNANTGLYSNDDATTIAYDNMGSSFHSTFIREPNGGWRVWGENMANSGFDNALNPLSFNTTNYPALTGTIYKMGIGSDSIYTVQLIVLTSTGLFALGEPGAVLDTSIYNSSTFHKITVNGKADGLPVGIGPADVKMLFVSTGTIMITTCVGEVFVLSQNGSVRGDGLAGNSLQWSKVMENATQPLTNVIVSRGSSQFGFALKANGSLWTWGDYSFLGDGTAATVRNYATQMTLPEGLSGVKAIQATADFYFDSSYYILGTDKKVYSLGVNSYGQLGDRTTVDRTVWVNAKNPNNSIITDAAWISANEHDANFPGLAVIKTGGVLYTAGENASYMIGRTFDTGVNYLALPTGVGSSDIITYAEVGGHTCALIKQGWPRYGYVGHLVDGSMGNGSTANSLISSYDFITPPIVAVCGTLCEQPTLSSNTPICPGQNAVFTISGTPGDIISYKINNGATQNSTLDGSGSAQITIASPNVNQTINLIYILGGTGSCSNALSISATVTLDGNALPVFTQVPSICEGQTLSPLPTTSNNGIAGTWEPPINNLVTTTYVFTPTGGSSCANTASMTIVVTPSGTVPTFTQVDPVCEGSVMTPLPTTSLEGITGSWSPALNNTTTTTYTFTPSAGTCLGNGQMIITINPKAVSTFTQVNPICQGATLNPLPTNSIEGFAGTWSPPLNNIQTTLYTFTPAANVCALSTSMNIEVNTVIDATFVQVLPICEGDTITPLPSVSTNGITGTWSPAINNMDTTVYTFTPDPNFCSNLIYMTIVVKDKVLPVFTAENPICYGSTLFNFPLQSNNGINGTWLPTINNTQTSIYTFTPNIGECAFTTTAELEVYEDFAFDYIGYCKEKDFYLEVLPLNNSFNMDTAHFEWQVNDITISNNAILDVTAYLNSTTTAEELPITFDIKVINTNGCEKSKSIPIDNVFCGIQKGISVNNDNLNEFFDLQLLDVKHLTIYNRYGMIVYSKANYLKEWIGQSDSGDQLPDGVYYYVIDFNNNNPVKAGWIYLNREVK